MEAAMLDGFGDRKALAMAVMLEFIVLKPPIKNDFYRLLMKYFRGFFIVKFQKTI